jgi:hypothetical protein
MKRSAPAVQVQVSRFELWNRGVGLLLLISCAALISWFIGLVGARDEHWAPGALVVAASVLALLIAGWSLRRPAVSLRWDGQCWHIGPIDRVGSEPWSVRVAVRVDLGHWMLLQVCCDQVDFPRQHAWLPLQRLGLQSQWHALRCALFAARRSTKMHQASSI